MGQPDGVRHGLAPDVRLRRPRRRGGGLRAAGGRPLRGDVARRVDDLALRPGLRLGYGLGVLDQGSVNFKLGVDAQRRESPMHAEASNGFMGRATLGW